MSKTSTNSQTQLLLSIGSNFPEKEIYLKKAAQLIESELGAITAFSKMYQSPSWGFEGMDFYNACLCVSTDFNTKKSLDILQAIEKQLGRIKKNTKTKGYQDRPIDIDIISSSEGVFRYAQKLTVPHPLMQERRFVLEPLLDIAPNWKHPLLHKTLFELLENCADHAVLKAVLGFEWGAFCKGE